MIFRSIKKIDRMRSDNFQNIKALRIAEDALKMGADILLSNQYKFHRLVENPAGGLCTRAELKVQNEIIDVLQNRYPNHFIVSEELENDMSCFDGFRPVWVLDPLDGSKNYINQFPHYCISLALIVKREIQISVVIDPMRDEIFTAMRGSGAQMNDLAVRANQSRTLHNGLIASCTHSYPEQNFELDNLQLYRELYGKDASVRRTGSFALDLVYSGCSRVDAFWGHGQNIWDMAAGLLFAREAGAIATSYTGESDEWFFNNKTIISGNILCHKEMLKLVSKNLTPKDNQTEAKQSEYNQFEGDQSEYDEAEDSQSESDQSEYDEAEDSQSEGDQSKYDEAEDSQSESDQSEYDESQANQTEDEKSEANQSEGEKSEANQSEGEKSEA